MDKESELTLARLIRNTRIVARTGSASRSSIYIYLGRFLESEALFSLVDFNLWKITPKHGCFVAGFARAFNLVPDAFRKASA